VTWASAEKLSAALDRKPGELFEKLEDRKLLSPKTIRHYLSFISDVFNYAIRMRMVKENPCKEVFLPTEQEAEREVFTLEEARRFLELLEGAPMKYRVFFTLAIYGGFRRGELMGLEWKDIDLETGVVSVVRTSQYSKTRGYYTDTPKTKRSVRSLKLPMNVMELLKRYRIEQGFEGRKMGDRWKGTDRLFTALDGTPMNGATPYVWLRKFCRANGLPPVNIHSFRHLNASLLINSGINVRTVSACLGHSQTSTTLNIYAHTFDEANARAMEAVADVLNGTGVSEAEKKQA
jgi:integrase